jgi:hypothetical protein
MSVTNRNHQGILGNPDGTAGNRERNRRSRDVSLRGHSILLKTVQVLAILLVVLLAGLLTPRQSAAQQTGEILGQLVDERTGQPVANAMVQLVGSSFQTTTDEQGWFRLRTIPPGTYRLQVRHIGFGQRTVDATVQAGKRLDLKVAVTETAITLAPLTVEALSMAERASRGEGFRHGLVTREQIARAESSNMRLPDVLLTEIGSIRVRRLERLVGSATCIELRQVRVMGSGCLSPAVYLDGAQVTNATWLYDNLDLRTIEQIEVIPASEAGVRFGPSALNGAILIQTRRPGPAPAERAVTNQRRGHDWKLETRSHRTPVVFLASAAGNAAGLAVGVTAARQCMYLRSPGGDRLASDCSLLPTLGGLTAAMVLPALGNSLAARLVGSTDRSRGELLPATVGAFMAILPGYALAISAQRGGERGMETTGYVLLTVGAPLMSTTADYLFRKLRNPD